MPMSIHPPGPHTLPASVQATPDSAPSLPLAGWLAALYSGQRTPKDRRCQAPSPQTATLSLQITNPERDAVLCYRGRCGKSERKTSLPVSGFGKCKSLGTSEFVYLVEGRGWATVSIFTWTRSTGKCKKREERAVITSCQYRLRKSSHHPGHLGDRLLNMRHRIEPSKYVTWSPHSPTQRTPV